MILDKETNESFILGFIYHALPLPRHFDTCIITGKTGTLFAAVTKQKLQYFGHVARREGVNLKRVLGLEKLRGKKVEEDRDSVDRRYMLYNK